MTFDARLQDIRFLPGCAGGVMGRTAIVDIAVEGEVPAIGPSETLRAVALGLHVKQPLYSIADADWPDGFVLASSSLADPAPGWLARWIVALTVAIQRWGFDPICGGEVWRDEPGTLRLAIGWRRSGFFTESLELALHLIATTVDGTAPAGHFTLPTHFEQRWAGIQSYGLSRYTMRIAEAAIARGMPTDVLPSYLQVGWGASAERFDMTFTGHTSWMAATLAKNKAKANRLFEAAALPIPVSRVVGSPAEVHQAATEIGWPVVVKPLNLDMGAGVTADIRGPESLARAYELAASLSSSTVLIERHEPGYCYRLLVVHGRVIAVARRLPAEVTGDGVRSIGALVDSANTDPRRQAVLNQIALDDDALDYLAEQGLTAESVPDTHRVVPLRRTAYLFSGGTHENVADIVHPDNVALAVRATRVAGLDIAGIDFITTDIGRSWRTGVGVLCEINGQPALSPHWIAEPGRDITGEILDTVFGGRTARIPTTAFIGAAADTPHLLHRMFGNAGLLSGLCTPAGIWIGEDEVSAADRAGIAGVRILLIDPGVQAAVFELPQTRLQEEGHPCDRYDVVVLDTEPDETGAGARAAVAVVRDADQPGAAPDDILVSAEAGHPALAHHQRRGGRAVTIDDGWLVLSGAEGLTRLVRWAGDRAALFAAAAGWAHAIGDEAIRRGLG